jgi:Beige/BEACH domain.
MKLLTEPSVTLPSIRVRNLSESYRYPVFPWVIQDYESQILDFKNPKTFRDLSKPIGALNEKRLNDFKERYKYMDPPKYLYGTHYSAPGYVIGYLVRKHPQYMLKFQSGKFDKPDRLFLSIKKDWHVRFQYL